MFVHASARPLGRVVLPFVGLLLSTVLACSSSSTPSSTPTSVPDADLNCAPVVATAAASSAAVSCSAPGEPTSGPADTHCIGSHGKLTVQSTNQASCCADGDAGGPGTCPYSATMYGHEGDDDDCKYHVVWASTPICEGASGVTFTVKATALGTGKPVEGANIRAEAFTTTPGDAGCDDQSTHLSPSNFDIFTEGPAGTYTGRVVFDEPGAWTVRFHLFENCHDVLDDSPHGHAAFHIIVP